MNNLHWSVFLDNGHEKCEYPDGSIYIGEWKNNKRHGQGFFLHKNAKYRGEWKNDQRDGWGISEDNFGTYSGYWKDDQKVVGEWSNGFVKYVGEWKNDERHGKGTLYKRKNNSTLWIPCYDGQFKEGAKHGTGIEYEECNETPFFYKNIEGYWIEGTTHGYCREFTKRYLSFEGEHRNGKRNGYGKQYYREMPFADLPEGAPHYEGEWKDGLRHGYGIAYDNGGISYIGTWVYGLFEGGGIMYKEGVECARGFFCEGTLIEGAMYHTNKEESYSDVTFLHDRKVGKKFRRYFNGNLFTLQAPYVCRIIENGTVSIGPYAPLGRVKPSLQFKKGLWLVNHQKDRFLETWRDGLCRTREKFLADWTSEEVLSWIKNFSPPRRKTEMKVPSELYQLAQEKKWSGWDLMQLDADKKLTHVGVNKKYHEPILAMIEAHRTDMQTIIQLLEAAPELYCSLWAVRKILWLSIKKNTYPECPMAGLPIDIVRYIIRELLD